ncbi:MAG: response regulator [Candidatus Melainabacteria bacterium]|nr:response regulator [Candidatus Melainabacteria bacterium]
MSSDLNIKALMQGFKSLNLEKAEEEPCTPPLVAPDAARASPMSNNSSPFLNSSSPFLTGSLGHRKYEVLIAEDSSTYIALIKRFKSEEFNLTLVENGKDAVEAASRHAFDVIITDFQMPIMLGNEAVAEIRKTDADIPIFVQSDTPDIELKEAFKGLNINGQVGKLRKVAQVLEILKSLKELSLLG